MRIQLLKKHRLNGKELPQGKELDLINEAAKRLIDQDIAKDIKGKYFKPEKAKK